MPAVGEQPGGVDPERLEALAQHLAALAECRRRDAFEGGVLQASGAGRGTRRTTDEMTFGGGVNAPRRRRRGCPPRSAIRQAR